MFCACECVCSVHPLEFGEIKAISVWNCMLQPYIESAPTLSDGINIYTFKYYFFTKTWTIYLDTPCTIVHLWLT